jgi:hypothetical protein
MINLRIAEALGAYSAQSILLRTDDSRVATTLVTKLRA